MTPQQFEQYCMTIKDTGAWGGEPEILALSRVYNVPIHVVQGGVPRIVEHNPGPSSQPFSKIVRISFHRRMYGLGEVWSHVSSEMLDTDHPFFSTITLCGPKLPFYKWLARFRPRSLDSRTTILNLCFEGVRNTQSILVHVSIQICVND
jgi:hypothetical protein